jgi:hypothetical protein
LSSDFADYSRLEKLNILVCDARTKSRNKNKKQKIDNREIENSQRIKAKKLWSTNYTNFLKLKVKAFAR